MGAMRAMDIVEHFSLEEGIKMHLRTNHYPPVPESMVPVCLDAIDAANEGDWNRDIDLPEGVMFRGLTTAPADAIVEQHHLEFWIIESELS